MINDIITTIGLISCLPFAITILAPKLGESDRKQRISYTVFALCFGSLLGFYDGFFGPGTGSLMNLACVTLLGFNLKFSLINFLLNWWSCDLDCWFSDDGRKPDRRKFRG